jgi:Cof subfamily protein (haloacid dehalogenase superfamily)
MDGTLLNNDKQVSAYSRVVLNCMLKSGIYFSVATARTAASAIKILSGIDINMPVVLMNGVSVYDISSGEYIKTEALSCKAAYKIFDVAKKNNLNGFMYEIDNNNLTTYYENLDSKAMRDFYDERMQNYYKSFKKVKSFCEIINTRQVVYFTLIQHYEKLLQAAADLKEIDGVDFVLYKDTYEKDLWFLEVFSSKASKYNAVNFLRQQYDFDMVIGFGDNYNDIPLFKACDESYAVSNAVDELKTKATGIISDNISDGVVKYIAAREKLWNV